MRRPVALLLWLLFVGALSGAACGSDDDPQTADDTRATTTTETDDGTTTTTTPEVDETEAAILAAVDGYWTSVREAGANSDSGHPGLVRFATGVVLQQSIDTIDERRALGQAVRLPEPSSYMHEYTVASVGEGEALVDDCSVDDTVLYELDTGLVLNDEVGTIQWETTLMLESGEWKVADNRIVEQWEGIAGCAV